MDVLLLDVQGRGTTEITISNGNAVVVEPLPATLSWRLVIDGMADEKSSRTLSADVRLKSKPDIRVASGNVTFNDRPEISFSSFRVTVTGTYTVNLFDGDTCCWSASVLVTDTIG